MIKFFQKLKAKKGFTLVELIVVIAIIGVLAAILIPTMMGYVTGSRVTSANTTAANIKNNVDAFLTDCDTAGYGMKLGAFYSTVEVTVGSGNWTVTVNTPGSFKNSSTISWTGTAAVTGGSLTKATATKGEELLALRLKELLPEVQTASAVLSLAGGKCVAVAYTEDTGAGITVTADYPTLDATGKFPASFTWNTTTAGISSSNGYIVGTAPAVPLGSGT